MFIFFTMLYAESSRIGSMHSSHFGKKLGPFFTNFTGVANATNEGSDRVHPVKQSQGADIVHVGSLETLCYTSGSQSVVQGPSWVLEGDPNGPLKRSVAVSVQICTLSELWGSLRLKDLRTTVQSLH